MELKLVSAVLFVVALLGLAVGLGWLINLRFESGEAYPVGSTVRADPMGTKALYESYADLAALEASRSYVPFDQLESLPNDAALVLLHTSAWGRARLGRFRSVGAIRE